MDPQGARIAFVAPKGFLTGIGGKSRWKQACPTAAAAVGCELTESTLGRLGVPDPRDRRWFFAGRHRARDVAALRR